MPSDADLGALSVAVDQAAHLLGRVADRRLDDPTPCTEWTVRDLVDHLVNAPTVFVTIMRGEQPDWGSAPPRIGSDREAHFRSSAGALMESWRALAFMQAELTVDNRTGVFSPEQPVPSDADAYARIAAFAGRAI
jgi:uncharacterized protein (TIGR03083 family)